MIVISVADQLATYDRSFFIAMSTPKIVQRAEMMSAFLCSSSSVADGVMRSSIRLVMCKYEFLW